MKDLELLQGKMQFLSALEVANSIPVLFAISSVEKATTTKINQLLSKYLGFSLSGGSLNNTLFSLASRKFVEVENEYSGKKLLRRRYRLSDKGLKLVEVLREVLRNL